jgi:hypothetical protein
VYEYKNEYHQIKVFYLVFKDMIITRTLYKILKYFNLTVPDIKLKYEYIPLNVMNKVFNKKE